MNKRKGILNVSFGIINLIITISLGLVIPRLTLVNLGSETNGLLSSINRMLQYAILLEAGVGTVLSFVGSCGNKIETYLQLLWRLQIVIIKELVSYIWRES